MMTNCIEQIGFLAAAVLVGVSSCTGGSGFGGLGGSGSVNCASAARADVAVKLERAYPNLTFTAPVALLQAPADASRWFVVERAGVIRSFDATNETTATSDVVINISGQVDTSGEGGLLGFAFHPRFATNGEAFLSYTTSGNPLTSIISRVRSVDSMTFDPATEEVILTLDQPFTNHNGGHIVFGPDGFLYIGFGDGGSSGDPLNNAQNLNNLFGALLRIDVDIMTPYGIPPDNPFVGSGGSSAEPQPEIYAYGLRNPWRFSFDRVNRTLWLGDVGQDEIEEVDIIENGGNYGWRCYEGSAEFKLNGCGARSEYIFPVAEYCHDEGNSITGGYVYRGGAIPELQGVYVFGDFVSGTIFGLFTDAGGFDRRVLLDTDLNIVSFGQGADGELYIVDFGGGVYRLVADGG
ncbi:MAG: PQQ-dependent sugar dehydrogenase [Nitrococcus sp.]|nr:PQQ-dependent sugar dehydrogenase [Nitrococcus sp.]